MKYSLATLRLDGAPTPTIEVNGRYWRLADTELASLVTADRRGLIGLLEDWPVTHERLKALAAKLDNGQAGEPALSSGEDIEFLTPLQYPDKLMCTGFNYLDHQKEAGVAFDKAKVKPGMFLKPPKSTLVGPGRSLPYPPQTEQLDYELELAVVIGRRCRSVAAADALDYVAGYMVGTDMSARDRQFDPRNRSKVDTIGGKCFEASSPVGPRLVPAEFAGDPQNFEMRLSVNGEVRISGNTSEMVYTIGEQLEEMARHMTLEPGDILLTGCPAGVGLATGRYLNVGDELVCDIGDLGPLVFQIAPPVATEAPLLADA